MNKIMLYVGLAILLGTVTMVAPLALLESNDSIPENQFIISVPEGGEPDSQDRSYEEWDLSESENLSAQTKPLSPEPSAPMEPSEPDATPEVPQEPELTLKTAETPADLSPIGLMAIPSFLVALGVFVFLRKRMS